MIKHITNVLDMSSVQDSISHILHTKTFKEINKYVDSNNNNNDNNNRLWYPRQCTRNTIFNVIYCATFGKTLTIDNNTYIEYEKCIAGTFKYAIDGLLFWHFHHLLVNHYMLKMRKNLNIA